jgi:hypothetical protein
VHCTTFLNLKDYHFSHILPESGETIPLRNITLPRLSFNISAINKRYPTVCININDHKKVFNTTVYFYAVLLRNE